MDLATIIGTILAFSLVIMAIVIGGTLDAFINLPSFLIVVGGTIGATAINYPLKDILKVIKVTKNAIFCKDSVNFPELISNFLKMADKARREGILSLEGFIKESHDEFLKYGLRLCVDGVEPQSIKQILEKDIKSSSERHELGANIFLSMGDYAPAFGMIGTLIGLVQMLAKLDDPSNIGPAMAVALITTFYGALLANAVFLPIAGKLKTKSEEEIFVKKIMLEGIMGISNGDNPRILEQKLNTFLPSKERVSFK